MAMVNSSEMSSMDSPKNHYSQLFSRMGDCCLVDTMQQAKNDLVTILTLKIRMVNQLMTELGLPLSFISHIQATSVPVHPEVAQELLRWVSKQEQADALLAQDFVLSEKLLKLIKSMCKSGHTNIAHALLAMDGLNGKLNQVPNTECKKYLENLKYSLSGEQGRYDRETNDDVKRAHVTAVRKVYQELDKHRSTDAKLVDGVYQVMRLVLKEFGGIELPDAEGSAWSTEALTEGVQVYKEHMKDEYFKGFVDMIKLKIANQTTNMPISDEDEASPSKKQKTK